MRYSSLVSSIKAQFERTNDVVYFIEGQPGGGKSSVAAQIGREMGFDNVVQFFASHRDVVDMLGTPAADANVTRWRPPADLMRLATGRNLLILEEVSDCPPPMQNLICGLVHDGFVGDLTLSPDTHVIMTGNRQKDKSGATRIVSKLAGRVRRVTFTESLDDWITWAQANNIDPVLIQFLRFRPNLLAAFDPNLEQSPTPRNWARASLTPPDLPTAEYLENIAGDVGEGAASEYVAFRATWQSLPDLSYALLNPTVAPVPDKLDVKYATIGALVQRVDDKTYANAAAYAARFPADFTVMFHQDVIGRNPKLKSSKTFIDYAVANQDLLFGRG
jgi:hypothetical protein